MVILTNLKLHLFCIIFINLVLLRDGFVLHGYLENRLGPLRSFSTQISDFLVSRATSENNYEILRKTGKLQDLIPDKEDFPCNLENMKSAHSPENVNMLRLGDIDVIAAIGDSLTAGIGVSASGLTTILAEDRGKSFSGGGEGTWRRYLTLPNILKMYNPSLIGYATRAGLSKQEGSGLNVAEGGATSDSLALMAEILVNKTKSIDNINVKKHWKMVSILIGSNNFCKLICDKKTQEEHLRQHEKDLLNTLRILRNNLPRTIVNLVITPDVEGLIEARLPFHCMFFHNLLCPCFFGLRHRALRGTYIDTVKKWQQIDIEISKRFEFATDDFAVVAQPTMYQSRLPKKTNGVTDDRYVSIDCFHMSQRGTAWVTKSLWKNILQPVGRKSKQLVDPQSELSCPSEKYPYIFTNRNSFYQNFSETAFL